MALEAENRAVWRHDYSNTVLIIIFILQCAGSIPNQQLLQLLDPCF
jgi:hypothetical protein